MKRQLDVDAEKNQMTVAEVHQLLDVVCEAIICLCVIDINKLAATADSLVS